MSKKSPFDYARAFSRNIGIYTELEQNTLRGKRVAIPGCGGVGGVHALVLARSGVGKFSIADFDRYEVENFNRQYGAKCSTLGREKVGVIRDEIADINPEAEVRTFEDGLTKENIDRFLEGVDVIIDSLDFFAFEARDLLFPYAQRKGIPLVTAAPLGLSCALLVFTRDSMGYEKYFDFRVGEPIEWRAIKFAMGLSPRATHVPYMQPDSIDLKKGRGPSTAVGVTLCAGMAAAECVKLLLGRGDVRAVPYFRQFDAYRGTFKTGRLRFGNRNLFQRLKMWYLKKFYLAKRLSVESASREAA